MRPIPIEDHLVPPGCKRVVIGPPDGDPTGDVRPVEAAVGIVDGGPRICMLVELEDGDLERLAHTPAIWLTMLTGQIPPWMMHIADGQDWEAEGLEHPDAGDGGS